MAKKSTPKMPKLKAYSKPKAAPKSKTMPKSKHNNSLTIARDSRPKTGTSSIKIERV